MPLSKLRPAFTFDQDRIEQLQEVVPEAFRDGKVNWEALREALGDHLEPEEQPEEHFGLFWPGKREARRLASKPSKGTLVPMPGEGVAEEDTCNLVIEGENLEVLKLLQKSYAGQVKMIYIDPPFNTGRDFIYNDDYSEPLESYLTAEGRISADGDLLTTNTKADGRFHSRWLSMMYPRLRLARAFLADDGIIFISIGEDELHHLRCIANEIFGEKNFLCVLIWVNEGNIDNQSRFKQNHEYVVVYARDEKMITPPPVIDPNIPENSKLYNEYIENTIVKNGPKNPVSPITLPAGFPADFDSGTIEPSHDESFWPKLNRSVSVSGYRTQNEVELQSGWSSKELFLEFVANDLTPITDSKGQETTFYLKDTGAVYIKKKRSEDQSHVLTVLNGMGTVQEASRQLQEINVDFDYPKPPSLIRYLIRIGAPDDAIVMDFFAGSGTTGEAVMLQNIEDGKNRRFVLIQAPVEARKGEIATISELARKRLKGSIERIAAGDGEDENGCSLGFRSFSLDRSNFKQWQDYDGTDIDEVQTLFDKFETPLVEDWRRDDLLAEILLIQGFPLDSDVTRRDDFSQNEVLEVSTDVFPPRLFVCLDDVLHDDTVRELQLDSDDTFVCLDSALGDEAKMRLADRCNLHVI